MKAHFKVLVSSKIRRKKPWSRIEWIGNVKESVCLIDRHRSSILYLPSGHTKKVIDAFKPHKKHFVCMNTSSSGEFVVACLVSGDVLRWHKDSNQTTIIPACPDFNCLSKNDASQANVFVSDDGQRIVSIVQNHQVNVWEEVGSIDEGEWTNVTLDAGLSTALASKETAIDARFFIDQIKGSCFLCTFVFSSGSNVNLCLLQLQWLDDLKPSPNAAAFVTSFSRFSFPLVNLHPECHTLRVRGCYIPRLAHHGRMVSLAINQLQPYLSSLLFVDVYQQAGIATSLKSVYKDAVKTVPSLAKTYWIKMMTWSFNDLFLVCITGRGSLLMYNNAGEQMLVTTHGLGLELGPTNLLPINPLVEPKAWNQKREEKPLGARPNSPISLASTSDLDKNYKQKFSVTSHPRLPIFICSDGFMVTALQLNPLMTPHDIAAFSLVEINHNVKLLIDNFCKNVEASPTLRYSEPVSVQDEAKFKEYKYTRLYLYIKHMFKRTKSEKTKEALLEETNHSQDDMYNALLYEFEKTDREVDSETEPESEEATEKHKTGVIRNVDEGKITFGDYNFTNDLEHMSKTLETMEFDGENLVRQLQENFSKMLSTFALLILEPSSSTFPHQIVFTKLQDKMHLYFIDTLQDLCKLVLTGQEASFCWPWNRDTNHDVGDFDYRDHFDNLLMCFLHRISFLALCNSRHTALVWKSVETVIDFILQLCTNAPEGCFSWQDIYHNIVAVLDSLTQVEQNLFLNQKFDNAANVLHNPDCYHLMNALVCKDVHTLEQSYSPIWTKFYLYWSQLCKSSVQQDSSTFFTIGRLVHIYMHNKIDSGFPNVVNSPLTYSNMKAILANYRLNSALHLASYVLYDHLNVKSKWTDNDWRAVELLCFVMEQYYGQNSSTILLLDHAERNIFLRRDIVTEAVKLQHLSQLWGADQCVCMLLLCGRLYQASKLASAVGSWKTALGIGAVIEKVRAFHSNDSMSPVNELLKARFQSLLPQWTILYNKQEDNPRMSGDDDLNRDLFDFNPENSAASFVELFTAGVMMGYDIASWGAKELLKSVKILCQNLPLTENEDFYLPSPPFYLPQPTPSDEQRSNLTLRHKISVQLRILFVIFHSVGAMPSLLLWYTAKLQNAKSEIGISSTSTLKSQSNSESEEVVREAPVLATIFRDVCAIFWMLHVRETLNISVRKYQATRADENSFLDVAKECLLWCSHMKPFVKYLDCEVELQSLVLCLCNSIAFDRQLISLLAYFFCDPDDVSPKLQPQLAVVMQKLRKSTEFLKSPRSNDSQAVGQSFSVIYQKQCRDMLKKQRNEKAVQNLFVKHHKNLNIESDNLNLELISLKACFSFESDTDYQRFIVKLFDVLSAKSDSLHRSVMQDGFTKWHKKILVVRNRKAIAEVELDAALNFMQQLKHSHRNHENESALMDVSQHYSSSKQDFLTSTYNKKQSRSKANAWMSFEDIEDSNAGKVEKALELSQYFTDSLSANHQNQESQKFAQDVLDRIKNCIKFDILDVFPAMRKRFSRLQSYFTWLYYWMEKNVSLKDQQLKPSIRITVTREQLLQSLFIAEVRFGGYSETALNGLFSAQSSVTNESISKAEIQPSAGPVDQKLSSVAETVTNMAESSTHSLEDEESNTIEEVADISNTMTEEVITKGKVEPEMEETKPKTIDDITIRLSPIQNEEETLSEFADGGSSRKHREKPLSSSKRDNNLASVVKDEIHNVLLAQQVSLLSQILLGQTLTGNSQGLAQILNAGEILKNLQGSQTQSENVQQVHSTFLGPKTKSATPEPNVSLTFDNPSLRDRSVLRCGRLMKKKQPDELGIPLFHVPGITKAQEPKKIHLVQTNNAKEAWLASSTAHGTFLGSVRHPKLLHPQQVSHIQGAYISHPIASTASSQPPKSPPQIRKPAVVQETVSIPPSHAASRSQPAVIPQPSLYKTAHPILMEPATSGFKAVRPMFQEQTNVSSQVQQNHFMARPFLQTNAAANARHDVFRPSAIQRPFCPSLIDPREVLAFQTKKQVSSKYVSSSIFRTIKPLPVLQLPLSKPQRVEASSPSTSSEPPRKEDPPETSKLPAEPVKETKVQKFDGYLNQEQINKEVLLLVNQLSDSTEKLTQANVHLIAAKEKQLPHKPRLVEAGMQAGPIEEEKSEIDWKEKATTKPLAPPPDIFDRVEKKFLHVADVTIDEVTRGIPDKSILAAERDVKAEEHLEYEGINQVPGFPEKEDKTAKSMLSEHIQDATRVAEVREVTRERWTNAMVNMDARIKALDAMSRNMQDDFKDAAKVADTLDMMSEMMLPEKTEKSGPLLRESLEAKAIHSISPEISRTTELHYKHTPPSQTSEAHVKHSLSSPMSLKTDSYKKRIQKAFELGLSDHSKPSSPRHPSVHFHEEKTSPRQQMPHAVDDFFPVKEVVKSPSEIFASTEEESMLEENKENFETLPPQNHLRPSHRKKTSFDLHSKPWHQKSEVDKEKVRSWMHRKQRERTAQYVNHLYSLKGNETRPFKSVKAPKSTNMLNCTDDRRNAKKRAMLSTHMSARFDDSFMLLDQMQHDDVVNKSTLRNTERQASNLQYRKTKKPSHRPAPYPRQAQKSLLLSASLSDVDNFDNISNSSVLSAWSLNDDVKRILYQNNLPRKNKGKGQVKFAEDRQTIDKSSFDTMSHSTGSLIENIDWAAVDAMIASLDDTDH